MIITGLRCEYMTEPSAVDSRRPLFSWEMAEAARGALQTGYRLLVSEDIAKLDGKSPCLTPKGEIKSSESLCAVYNGRPLKPYTRYFWRVAVKNDRGESALSEIASFVTGRLGTRWQAKWIGRRERQGRKRNAGAPSPYLFKRFQTKSGVREALLFATARGVYNAVLNGEPISDEILAPGWTNFQKTFYYQGYDVTSLVREGKNAIGVCLGDGWYFGNLSAVGRNQYGTYPRLFTALLIIRYNDGTEERITTDSGWCTGEGPIRYADLQTGEFFDGNMRLSGFGSADFDESGFSPVLVRTVREELTARRGEPITVDKELVPVNYSQVRGRYIFDMGQNMVGRIRLKVKGEKGKRLRIRYGEMLNTDKSLYTANLRSCEATDWYITSGDGFETWEATFTVHGFRYVELSGLDYAPSLDAVTGIVIRNGLDITGSFECNDGLINKLFGNILWGQRGNFLAVPTDCPQRDERLGWTGDSQIFCQSGCYNMYSDAFYEKYVHDIMDEQRENGAFTDIAPFIHWPNGNALVGFGNAAWGDAGVIIPWLLWVNYGNRRILSECFPKMVKYIELLKATSEDGVRTPASFGDWLCLGKPTPYAIVDTAYMINVTDMTAKAAGVLGETEKQALIEDWAATARDGFIRHFVSDDGTIEGDTQTCYALALRFGIGDSELRKKFAKKLADALDRADGHLTTGFVGVKELLPALCDAGMPEKAYKLLENRTYPSWLYSVVNGATTVWERWNSYTIEDGFASITMNSFNHYSLGSVAEWLYGYVGGIRPAAPGWAEFTAAPEIGSLSFAKVKYHSPRGEIKSEWERRGDGYRYSLSVPANSVCRLALPASEKATVTEILYNETPAFTRDGGRLTATLLSGNYLFEVKEEKK